MPVWNSEQYLRFARERTQPSRDLAARTWVPDGGLVLDEGEARAFEAQVLERIRTAFPQRAGGGVVLRFPRLFWVASRA